MQLSFFSGIVQKPVVYYRLHYNDNSRTLPIAKAPGCWQILFPRHGSRPENGQNMLSEEMSNCMRLRQEGDCRRGLWNGLPSKHAGPCGKKGGTCSAQDKKKARKWATFRYRRSFSTHGPKDRPRRSPARSCWASRSRESSRPGRGNIFQKFPGIEGIPW